MGQPDPGRQGRGPQSRRERGGRSIGEGLRPSARQRVEGQASPRSLRALASLTDSLERSRETRRRWTGFTAFWKTLGAPSKGCGTWWTPIWQRRMVGASPFMSNDPLRGSQPVPLTSVKPDLAPGRSGNVVIHTHGCKLNQADSSNLPAGFARPAIG